MADIKIPDENSGDESSENDDPVDNLSDEDDDDDDEIIDATNDPDDGEIQEDDDLESSDPQETSKLDSSDSQNLLTNNLVNNITDLQDIDSEQFLQKFDNFLLSIF